MYVSIQDLDIWFSGTKTKGKKTITFEQFKKILDAIAKKSGVSAKDIHSMYNIQRVGFIFPQFTYCVFVPSIR